MSQQFCLKWNNHTTNMLQVFENLLSTEALVDVTLACEGLSLKAHKMVLSACSPFFQSLFLENPCKHPIVIMKDMRYCDLKAIIDFMYRGEVNVSHDQLSALLKTAETLKVKGLAEVTGEKSHASGIVQQEIVQQTVNSTPATPTAQRTDTPPLAGKRKRGRPRKRSLSDSNRSDDEGIASKIKERDSPCDVEELSGDASLEATSDIRSGGGNPHSQAHSSSHAVNNFSKSHLSISQDEDQVSGDDGEFEVEPSKLLEQTLTTDNVPSNSHNSTGHINLPSVSGLEISRRSMSSTDSVSQALVPASDSLSSNLQAPDSPQDIKPQILSFDDPPISPVAGPSHSSERSMMMYMDQAGVASIPGPSNYQDGSALVPHDSQPQVLQNNQQINLSFVKNVFPEKSAIPRNRYNPKKKHPTRVRHKSSLLDGIKDPTSSDLPYLFGVRIKKSSTQNARKNVLSLKGDIQQRVKDKKRHVPAQNFFLPQKLKYKATSKPRAHLLKKKIEETKQGNRLKDSVAKCILPKGWTWTAVERKAGQTKGNVDLYFFSPDGKKFRSKNEIETYLKESMSKLSIEDFIIKRFGCVSSNRKILEKTKISKRASKCGLNNSLAIPEKTIIANFAKKSTSEILPPSQIQKVITKELKVIVTPLQFSAVEKKTASYLIRSNSDGSSVCLNSSTSAENVVSDNAINEAKNRAKQKNFVEDLCTEVLNEAAEDVLESRPQRIVKYPQFYGDMYSW